MTDKKCVEIILVSFGLVEQQWCIFMLNMSICENQMEGQIRSLSNNTNLVILKGTDLYHTTQFDQ